MECLNSLLNSAIVVAFRERNVYGKSNFGSSSDEEGERLKKVRIVYSIHHGT